MLALALALDLVAAPVNAAVPPLDPGPFDGAELAASSLGAVAGDALVVGAGLLTLQLFAQDAFYPSAPNFRRAAYAMAFSSLVVPPLTAVLIGRLARAQPAAGSVWKALLLATAGQAIALGAGYLAAPQFWVFLPVQLVTVAIGTTLGFHWGPRSQASHETVGAAGARAEEPAEASPVVAQVRIPFPTCPVE